ncbi:MAG TPA: feruloyl-CoA synthase [Burkholderiales bacterium]|nr:feruloyl-CoA synthase [Burkholderiales bacterium]
MTRPTRRVRLGPRDVLVERRPGDIVHLRSPHALPAYPRHMAEKLVHWADRAPQRILFAQRNASGAWRSVAYGEALESARRVGAALLERGLSAERPLMVLSGNDIEHALLHLGALYVGVPYAPVSPAYSLLSADFAKLRTIVRLLTPGVVYANGDQYRRAIDAVRPGAVVHDFEELQATPGRGVEEAYARVGPDSIAKFLFTSGSTGVPKAVINTQRMWCSNQAMISTMFAFFSDEPPVIVDWAPWHHTAAGNHDFGLVLYNGGSYYIDEGKPMPGAVETTVRNLREIAPTWYFNVPKGYEALLPFLKKDHRLRENFFSRLKVLWFAGAAISQHVFDEIKQLAWQTCGETIPFLTGFGATETAPAMMGRLWDTDNAANMGLPPPGVEMKLVPFEDRLEARVKGPNVTPGYWRQPELTAAAFDEDGYYRLGDCFVFEDVEDPRKGLLFRGRIAEDFKLATGTWVNVGPLRARFIEHFAPLVRDVVIAGEGRGELGALIFPAGNASPHELQLRLSTFKSTGSSNRISRVMVLEDPPSLDAGEMTDKGSINQRAVLNRRKAMIEELYREPPGARVIWI